MIVFYLLIIIIIKINFIIGHYAQHIISMHYCWMITVSLETLLKQNM